uniref:Uncharacterized protein n=1 Tax=viral metagenome TaxID=1070528 RepID=A0A6M3M053_9ZZZZ
MVVYGLETVIRGRRPYLQHNPRCIRLYSEWRKEQKKTVPPPEVEAEWGVYENEEGPFIPSDHIEGAILGVAKDTKLEKMRGRAAYDKISRSVEVVPLEIPLMREGERIRDYEVLTNYARIRGARIERSRPKFNLPWEVGFDVRYNMEKGEIDIGTVKKMVIKSGDVGIGDWRPKYGQYDAEIVKVKEI